MRLLYLLLGIIGVTIGAFLLSIGNEDTNSLPKFLYQFFGMLIFIITIILVRKSWK